MCRSLSRAARRSTSHFPGCLNFWLRRCRKQRESRFWRCQRNLRSSNIWTTWSSNFFGPKHYEVQLRRKLLRWSRLNQIHYISCQRFGRSYGSRIAHPRVSQKYFKKTFPYIMQCIRENSYNVWSNIQISVLMKMLSFKECENKFTTERQKHVIWFKVIFNLVKIFQCWLATRVHLFCLAGSVLTYESIKASNLVPFIIHQCQQNSRALIPIWSS